MEDGRPEFPDTLYPEARIGIGRRFLLRAEVAPFLLPSSIARWPDLIPIDEGPFIDARPRYWNLQVEDDRYVYFQGRLANGYHEWLHIPASRMDEVRIYEVTTALQGVAIRSLLPEA